MWSCKLARYQRCHPRLSPEALRWLHWLLEKAVPYLKGCVVFGLDWKWESQLNFCDWGLYDKICHERWVIQSALLLLDLPFACLIWSEREGAHPLDSQGLPPPAELLIRVHFSISLGWRCASLLRPILTWARSRTHIRIWLIHFSSSLLLRSWMFRCCKLSLARNPHFLPKTLACYPSVYRVCVFLRLPSESAEWLVGLGLPILCGWERNANWGTCISLGCIEPCMLVCVRCHQHGLGRIVPRRISVSSLDGWCKD